jgi:hypothetical protein
MKLRWKTLTGIAVMAGITLLVSVIHHFQLKGAVERYKAELKAKGEPMELAEVIPTPVPPDKNATDLFLKAVTLLNTNESVLTSNQPPAMRMVGPGNALIGWQQPFIRDHAASNSWEEVQSALNMESDGLKLLRQIPNQGVFDFKLDYSQGFETMKLSPLATAKKAAQKLMASTINNLRIGNSDAAIENNEAMLAVAQGLTHDRIVISELVRMAIIQMAQAATWELLQATNLSEPQLAGLQEKWR